ncbi:disks large-associated protein 5-like [Macrosteles quadrilineatus]|uniref:disks large-associated protein 5-like n=1 Tax=Macrosteles quadrilineatus TaxID=74068 RepID=UPI0023E2E930|nr:disks large-associated protein 5-like [Macrosteles quadrilineatus]XP_054289110.1 disks large-associated protein 5-like [Macrosteles quadrilineatus]
MDSCIKQLRDEYDCERTKLLTLCEKWQDILEKAGRHKFSEDNKGAILAVIGQTKLLVDKKLKKFEGLLMEREQNSGDSRLITEADLRGYWEMVMIEVDLMAAKFDELKDLAENKPKSTRATNMLSNRPGRTVKYHPKS